MCVEDLGEDWRGGFYGGCDLCRMSRVGKGGFMCLGD